ncbi:MAG: hypothetical protein ACFCUV_22800 [Rivularia sp. (in: cyanobacteria)]
MAIASRLRKRLEVYSTGASGLVSYYNEPGCSQAPHSAKGNGEKLTIDYLFL